MDPDGAAVAQVGCGREPEWSRAHDGHVQTAHCASL